MTYETITTLQQMFDRGISTHDLANNVNTAATEASKNDHPVLPTPVGTLIDSINSNNFSLSLSRNDNTWRGFSRFFDLEQIRPITLNGVTIRTVEAGTLIANPENQEIGLRGAGAAAWSGLLSTIDLLEQPTLAIATSREGISANVLNKGMSNILLPQYPGISRLTCDPTCLDDVAEETGVSLPSWDGESIAKAGCAACKVMISSTKFGIPLNMYGNITTKGCSAYVFVNKKLKDIFPGQSTEEITKAISSAYMKNLTEQ